MDEKNYYEILQVSPNASIEIIKIAYKSLVKKYHPDNNENVDIENIREINEAYQILSNPEKRQEYDEEMNIIKNEEAKFTDSIIGLQEKIYAVLEKISRMFVNIVDNNSIYFSSRLDINTTIFYGKCRNCIYLPEDEKVFVLYGYRYSGSSCEIDEAMALTETGVYFRDGNMMDTDYVKWEDFVDYNVHLDSNHIWIGNHSFTSSSSDDLFAILKETHRLFNSEDIFEDEYEERASVICMKVKHNVASIITAIVLPVFFFIKGWDNWFIKVVDALFIWWLCDFTNQTIELFDFEEQTEKIAKWVIYGAGVLIWFILTK